MKFRYLPTTAEHSTPRQFVAIGASISSEDESDGLWSEFMGLRAWSLTTVRAEKGKEPVMREFSGDFDKELWRRAFEPAKDKTHLWVFGYEVADIIQTSNAWTFFTEDKWSLDWYALEDPPVIIKLHRERASVTIVDVRNYFDLPMKDLAKKLGLEHVPLRTQRSSRVQHFERARYAAEIARRSAVSLFEVHERWAGGRFKPTLASLAKAKFCAGYCPQKNVVKADASGKSETGFRLKTVGIIELRDDKCGKEVERKACFGGRTSAWWSGPVKPIIDEATDSAELKEMRNFYRDNPRIYRLDCNSLYPFVMATRKHPFRFIEELRRPNEMTLAGDESEFWYMAEVTVNTAHDEYPVRINGVTRFHKGAFRTVLCGDELERAMQGGQVHRIHWARKYAKRFLFEDWCRAGFNLRRTFTNEDRAECSFACKMLLNALSGVWGKRSPAWLSAARESGDPVFGEYLKVDAVTGKMRAFRALMGKSQEKAKTEEVWGSAPALYASITSAGRVRMDALRLVAREEEVYYQGTDSLHVSTKGYLSLLRCGRIHQTEPGLLKVEAIADNAVYAGIANYMFGSEMVVAGLPAERYEAKDGKFVARKRKRAGAYIREPANAACHWPEIRACDLGSYRFWEGQYVGRVDSGHLMAEMDVVDPAK